MRPFLAIAVLALAVSARSAVAALDISSITFSWTENFDSLTGVPFGPMGENWQNDSTLPGWSLFRTDLMGGAIPINFYDVGNGNSNNARVYSFGSDGHPDRALGSVGDGKFGDQLNETTNIPFNVMAGWIAVSFRNVTGGQLDEFTMHYDGEQWRDSGEASQQKMEFEYGIGDTFGLVTNWIKPGPSFNFLSLHNTMTADKVDGNLVANRSPGLGGTVTGVQDWNDGATLWLRWIELNDGGSDHGLAIDNFSFSLAPVPEPSAVISGVAVCGLLLLAAVARRFAFWHAWTSPTRKRENADGVCFADASA